jgi:uncharacterized membrane protein YcjF (UPF0283 family)
MTEFDANLSAKELLQIAADHHHKRIELTEEDRRALISAIKQRAVVDLEYGEELVVDGIRLVHRVTGAVGLYFGSGD